LQGIGIGIGFGWWHDHVAQAAQEVGNRNQAHARHSLHSQTQRDGTGRDAGDTSRRCTPARPPPSQPARRRGAYLRLVADEVG
jgi:hypothetical protein